MAKEKEHPQGITPRTHKNYSTLLKSLQHSSQNFTLLRWLVTKGNITPLEAWSNLGIYRLSGRIHDLREMGVEITTFRVEVTDKSGETKHVAKYVLDQ